MTIDAARFEPCDNRSRYGSRPRTTSTESNARVVVSEASLGTSRLQLDGSGEDEREKRENEEEEGRGVHDVQSSLSGWS